MISRSMENYLKAIYRLGTGGSQVSTSQLAKNMECTPASVTKMLQKLSELKLIEYQPYQGVRLTEAGNKVALEVVRHHRLLESYLAEALGYSWDEVHAEAEELEHVISEEFENRIDKLLGHPTRDPHGHPIPTKDGSLPEDSSQSLWNISSGQDVIVRLVSDRNPEALRYLASIGIYPQVEIGVVSKAPFNGPLHIDVDDKRHSLSEELARQIYVVSK